MLVKSWDVKMNKSMSRSIEAQQMRGDSSFQFLFGQRI